MIPLGTCSKHPRKLTGRRVRVVAPDAPHFGKTGVIDAVTGRFAYPHDGVGELECVHVDQYSSFAVLFGDTRTSGYPPWALSFGVRYKVWTIDPDGEPSALLLRSGCTEDSEYDVSEEFGEEDTEIARLVKWAWVRTETFYRNNPRPPVLVKNFDTDTWFHASADGDDVVVRSHQR